MNAEPEILPPDPGFDETWRSQQKLLAQRRIYRDAAERDPFVKQPRIEERGE
jgi:hypothetical protein